MNPGRFVFIVLDGVGVGELPDAAAYGDAGSNTLGNLSRYADLRIPNLTGLGLANVTPLRGVSPVRRPSALVGRLAERSAGKDTTVGHWEHMGIVLTEPFPTYPKGFPPEVVQAFEGAIGRRMLGNKPASGTEIIAELGEEHMRTGRPIVYTSADSVFQIAAHVDVIPLEELYDYCRKARRLLTGRHRVGRVIARPFAGAPGDFQRTRDRKDFSVEPPDQTALDRLLEAGVQVTGMGKIPQIFAGRGITHDVAVGSNLQNLETLTTLLSDGRPGLFLTNLVDFDMKWGHRNDPEGFAQGLEEVDSALPGLLAELRPGDRLLLTADHGVDPTTVSTDHSREFVPLLLYPRPDGSPSGVYEGWFSDTGATVLDHFLGEPGFGPGRSVFRLAPDRGWAAHPANGATDRPRATFDPAEAVAILAERFGEAPPAAVILGSGLDTALREASSEGTISFAELPSWSSPQVEGHAGVVEIAGLGGIRAVFVRGRVHRYEDPSGDWARVVLATLAEWGVGRLLVTNASGSLESGPTPGSVVFVDRVIDLQEATRTGGGERVLAANDEPSLEQPHPQVYAAVSGPQYETSAEAAVLRGLGATVVGMSTVDELTAGLRMGMEVSVLTVVTNRAGTVPETGPGGHAEVLARAQAAAADAARCVTGWLAGG